jgi:hypothetical protein
MLVRDYPSKPQGFNTGENKTWRNTARQIAPSKVARGAQRHSQTGEKNPTGKYDRVCVRAPCKSASMKPKSV